MRVRKKPEEPEKLSDTELVERFKETQENRYFQELFDRHWESLLHRSYKIVKDIALSQDVVQDTFLKALRQIKNFKVEEENASVRYWLEQICKNRCLDALRRRRTRRVNTPELRHRLRPQSPVATESILLNEVLDSLNALQKPYRISYVLFRIIGYSYDEVASITGYSHKQVKAYIRTAQRNLAKKF